MCEKMEFKCPGKFEHRPVHCIHIIFGAKGFICIEECKVK